MTSTALGPSPAPARKPLRERLLHPDPMIRRLAGITLVNCLGNGLTMALGVLYFTRVLGFGAARVGLALTLAGACGVLAGIPAGRAADRWGVRPVLIGLVCVEAVGLLGYAVVRDYALFLPLACLVTVADRGSAAVRSALYAEVLPPETRVVGRAYLRVVTNIGIGVGTSAAALALHVDTRAAYVTAIVADALSFALVAVLYALVIPSAPTGADAGAGTRDGGDGSGRGSVLRDRRYLAVTLLNAVLCLQFPLLEVGVPLWIVEHTDAPRVLVAGSLIVNTVLVVLLQVRAARGTGTVAGAGRVFRGGGLLVALGWVVLGLAHGLPGWAAALLVVGAVLLQALGEVTSQAAGWALGYDLAEEGRHGTYQGVFNSGQAAAFMLGPVLVTSVVLPLGMTGWLLAAGVFAAAGLAMPLVVRGAPGRAAV
ncbi:MFS transporter [Kitasatospora sp. NPDC096147]|uniref:MFS transporter n=1 Tax=Kitasatospora sp. NPDC096147 TaxID=3364093 RepID=UPI003807BA76